jgi:hypothetical protein
LDLTAEAMMPIAMRCRCGKEIRVPDDAAGRKVRCKACGGLSTVPMELDGGAEVVDADEPAPRPRPAHPDPPAVAQAHAGAATGPFSTTRVLLNMIAFFSGATMVGCAFRPDLQHEGFGTAALCLTMALAGLAASRPLGH